MSCGVIVVAPPWPRSGSGNIFAAQVAAHARRGARVLLLLAPAGRGFAYHKTQLWQDAVSSMAYAGVDTVAYPRARRGRPRAYIEWLRAGRDDALGIMARFCASGRLPPELHSFLANVRLEFIHVNHAFSILLAQRVARLAHRMQGRCASILLDTHDIQSDVIHARGKKNPLSRRPDSRADLLRTELALCAQADALVHVTRADCDFFAARLPQKHHAVVLPTLDPKSEAGLVQLRGAGTQESTRSGGARFLYIGNQHEANLVTVRWLLTQVLPLASQDVARRIRIIGSIGGLLRRRDPELFTAHAEMFAGEVPSIYDCYSDARAVLAPATAGTGASIKLIEALCAGKPTLTTSLGVRGLPADALIGCDIEVHDTAPAFAAALTRWSGDDSSVPGFSRPNAAVYDRLLSNERYFSDLQRLSDYCRTVR